MSASLVGSEMCIRDRFETGCGGRPARRCRCNRWGPPSPEEAVARAPTGACLLYTSDAADDM
eukprot:5225668-Alexandrium_andersonii.AAC.1